MTTINEIAKSLNVSRQTIYNVVKNNGISLDELTIARDGKKRILKDEAEDVIKRAMSIDNKISADNEGKNVVKIDNVYNKDALKKALKDAKDARREPKEEREKNRKQAEEIEKLRAQADALRENNDIMIRTIATNAVTIQTLEKDLKERALLTSANGHDQDGGRIRRTFKKLFGRKDGKE